MRSKIGEQAESVACLQNTKEALECETGNVGFTFRRIRNRLLRGNVTLKRLWRARRRSQKSNAISQCNVRAGLAVGGDAPGKGHVG